jgi:hypothetical protein
MRSTPRTPSRAAGTGRGGVVVVPVRRQNVAADGLVVVDDDEPTDVRRGRAVPPHSKDAGTALGGTVSAEATRKKPPSKAIVRWT